MKVSIAQLSDLKKVANITLRQYALDAGLIAGHGDYVKFIILGRSRTGTNFLRGLLNSHPRVVTFGELFRHPHAIRWGLPELRQESTPIGWDLPEERQSFPMSWLSRRYPVMFLERDPVAFLAHEVFRKFPTDISAVGFKIFYYHAHDALRAPVWHYLREQPVLKAIHVKRRNVLKTFLSRKRAAISRNWVSLSGKEDEPASIVLDYDECLRAFVKTRAWEQEYEGFFKSHPQLELIYEQLASDIDAQMKRVQEFLGVPYQPVTPRTYRQSYLPLSHAIVNYEELKTKFAGTPWHEFFDE
jgi:LPS sulfotransferase NodH